MDFHDRAYQFFGLAAANSVIIPSQPSFLSAKGLDLLNHAVKLGQQYVHRGQRKIEQRIFSDKEVDKGIGRA